ncbi:MULTISPECIES: lytic transglycosylase domain-containing protein [Subtercola]|uniref:Transglycosylase SLT domain-containing protein n=1 Tax=Subtercola vilae TaxID=2056433 RepID=A0A4V4RFS4_9MICO|nr:MULTISPECIES: lytic murein transglycosylase [Subtercola]MEA9984789.1 lytic murein transglycosylase [Subtercola sp. RTI3]TIH38984.1 hypothetical protein D4765_05290 [Subtercola vilae]
MPSRRRRRRGRRRVVPHRRGLFIALVFTVVVVVLLVAGIFAAGPLGEALRTVGSLAAGIGSPDAPATPVAPPESPAVSRSASTPAALAGHAGEVDAEWAGRTAAATGIPLRAVQAYAGVAIASQNSGSTCHLGWNTLAAIGTVESANGTYAGSTIGADGTVSPPIYGIALDGAGVTRIPDTDGGAIDGDAEWDRAVGPMQLIPETWRNWGTDASGDGIADPQNIDDASLATANYLCYHGRDVSVASEWMAAITSYNDATSYLLKVSQYANRYALEVASVTG